MYTKYEVFMSNPVAGEVCTDDDDTNTNDNGQSMIEGSLVDKRNESKSKKRKVALDSFDTSIEQPSVCKFSSCLLIFLVLG